MTVDFFSFDYAPTSLKREWSRSIEEVIDTGVLIGGSSVNTFEKAWANYTKSQFAVGVGNGLDGLILALRALQVSEGDLVALPAHTFIATWNAVISVGAIPVGIDVDEHGLMDLDKLENLISNLKAVIPVHMHGATVDLKRLSAMCSDSNLRERVFIIEDASQAHGGRYPSGENIGKYSDVAVYSCYPTKNLGALGDAGVVTTNSINVQQDILLLRSYGSRANDKYRHEKLGFNSRLDPIQAAILNINLGHLSQWNTTRQELYEIYLDELGDYLQFLQRERADSVRHHVCVLSKNRDNLRNHLLSRNIGTDIHYPNVAGTEALRFKNKNVKFDNSQRIANQTLSLPLSQWHKVDQIYEVVEAIKNWFSK